MSRMERVGVGFMMAGQGSGRGGQSVFAQASDRWEKRKAATQARAEASLAKEHGAFWEGILWQQKKEATEAAEARARAEEEEEEASAAGKKRAWKSRDVAARRADQARQVWPRFATRTPGPEAGGEGGRGSAGVCFCLRLRG